MRWFFASTEGHTKQFSDSRNSDISNPIGRIGSHVDDSAAAVENANFIPINALKVSWAGPQAIAIRRRPCDEVADVPACKRTVAERLILGGGYWSAAGRYIDRHLTSYGAWVGFTSACYW